MALLPMIASAYDAEIDGIYYNFYGNEATVTVGDDGYAGAVVIPSSVTFNDKTYNVTSIGEYAFYGCIGLTSVTIPNSVTSIGGSAFYGCQSLTSVTIPNSVTSIGGSAFYNCQSLTSVTIPNSVTSIGDYAFEGCGSLQYNEYDEAFYLGNDENQYVVLIKAKSTYITDCDINTKCKVIYTGAFSGCSSLTSVSVPNSVTCINYRAFENCGSLQYNEYDEAFYLGNDENPYVVLVKAKSTYITDCDINIKCKVIYCYAFHSCEYLTSVIIGDGVTSIGEGAFYGCSCLTSITIPNNVTSIREYAFYNCSGLTSVTIGNGVTCIGECAFSCCSGLTSVTIGNGVTCIGEYAFNDCYGLTSVIIPDNVTSIGSGAFSNCSGLIEVTIGTSVTSIGSYAFEGCECLTLVTLKSDEIVSISRKGCSMVSVFGNQVETYVIGDGVMSIGDYAFFYCSGLAYVTIPNSVTSIGKYAFDSCYGLNFVNIPGSVTSIGDYAFFYCSGLAYVTIGNSVTSIGEGAFAGCSSLTSVTIPNSVTNIGNFAFDGCKGLTSVTIPNSVTSIGNYVFEGCEDLTSINVNVGNTTYDSRNNCNAIIETATNTLIQGCQNTIIPNSVTSIGEGAFSNCSGLTSVTIPNSVTSIGDYAFNWCSGLTDVYCLAKDVPETNSDAFDVDYNDKMIHATLHVPASALEAYRATKPWSQFKDFVELTEVEVMGDLNGDGKVDIADAVCVLDVMANGDYNSKADLNEDGKIDIADFVCVLDIMAKQ